MSIKSFPDYKHLLQENYLDMLERLEEPTASIFRVIESDSSGRWNKHAVTHYNTGWA